MTAIKVPPLGESIVEATISRWLKKEGDAVAVGETLVELETDKITVEVPAQSAGVLRTLLKKEGDVVSVGEALAELEEGTGAPSGGASASAASGSGAGAPPQQQSAPAAAGEPNQNPAAGSPAPPSGEVRASPAARRVAAEQNVDLAGVQGTGRGGVVSKPDVITQGKSAPAAGSGAGAPPQQQSAPAAASQPNQKPAVQTPAPRPADGARETREKMTTRRKRIAENLLQSQQMTAHLTTFNEIDMSAVSALRERLKERVEKEHGVKLSFMPFFAKATAMALKSFPTVNAQIDGDTVVYKHYVNLGIAVASDQGLVVPNIKDADRLSMVEFSRQLGAVAKRARDAKLTMDDLTGGTFTITNGGVFGSLLSTPIINYPQVGILGLHKTQDRPIAVSGRVEIRPMMYVALSYDHRIIDGQQAVLFLVRVKELMEDPAAMLIE
jgi:2-oxoglutarate dehydrogenase E2 component (dihydrolipoamide succinyltransferase)